MKTSWSKISSAVSLVMASALASACGAGDMNGPDVGLDEAASEEGGDSEDIELGSLEQGLHSCATPDGANAVMAALAVAAAQDLGRWRAGLDFEVYNNAIRLTSGTGSDGKPRGKSRCSGGVCSKIEPLLAMQQDSARNQVYIQAESSGTKVLVDPPALRSRTVAKLQEQMNKDRDMKDGDTYQAPKTPHALTGAGTANLQGCGPHFKFNVAFNATTTTPKPLPAQLKWSLSFADQQNGWVDFRDLGNNVVAIDPTYGLNEGSTTTSGSCEVACTKVSSTDVVGRCCSCSGAARKFKRSAFSTSVYLCQ
jgi:hypothetical protein